jgi:hypothetical protein
MARLRVRRPSNAGWLDICQSEWYARNESNTGWVRLLPKNGMKARHGSNEYWLDINCVADPNIELCEDEDEFGGTPDGKGSNGTGPDNPHYNGPGKPWLPPKDWPADRPTGGTTDNSGNDNSDGNGDGTGGWSDDDLGTPENPGTGPDGAVSPDDWEEGMPPVDWYPGIPMVPGVPINTAPPGEEPEVFVPDEPYPDGYDDPDREEDEDRLEPEEDLNSGECLDGLRKGAFDCPYNCTDNAFGDGKGYFEFYIDMGTVNGPVVFPYMIALGTATIDMWHAGKKVASTEGPRSNVGTVGFDYKAVEAGNLLFVRVRTHSVDSMWAMEFKCPNETDLEGSLLDPRPCKGTFLAPESSGSNVIDYYHDMGEGSGEVEIRYQMWNTPDRIDILRDGVYLTGTSTFVSGEGKFVFDYEPGGSNLILVRIISEQGDNSWVYTISCPGELGTEDNPRECIDNSIVHSGGAGITDTFVEMGPIPGRVGIRYQMWWVPDQMDVYQGSTLVATTGEKVTGDHWLYFDYDPSRGTKIQIRITGEGKTTWLFFHTCPGDHDVNVSIDSPSILEGAEGEVTDLCWSITLDKPSSAPISVDYATTGGTARPIAAQGSILGTDAAGNPFVAVVDQPQFGRAVFDGGFPKFYNSQYREPQTAPTGSTVFNSWWRTAAGSLFTDPSTIPDDSEASKWVLNADDTISALVNSSGTISFISPEAYPSYSFDSILSSNDSDDDAIGLVIAYVREGNQNHMLVATRHAKGWPRLGENFSIVYLVNNTVVEILDTVRVGENRPGWSGASTKVRVERNRRSITCRASDWNSSTYSTDILTVDLTANEALSIFIRDTRWGFWAWSQRNATFSAVFLEGIGLPPAFAYLRNLSLWSARPTSRNALLIARNTGNYSIDDQPMGFNIGIRGTLESVGFNVTTNHLSQMGNKITSADLQNYDLLVVISNDAVDGVTGDSPLVVGNWVKQGGGLIVITDHDVFQTTANKLASMFNVEFYGDFDRSPIEVDDIIARHGPHPAWEGLNGDVLPMFASEGAIRLIEASADFTPIQGTVTFEPGEQEKKVCLPVIGNDIEEPDRTIEMTISNATNDAAIIVPVGIGTIIDDDSAVCRQDASAPVFENNTRIAHPDGAYMLHVQPYIESAPGNTWYLMQRDFDFPEDGAYVFTFINDDDFELYIDCKLVAGAPFSLQPRMYTVNVKKGKRNMIVRYLNIPHNTPGFVGFSIRRHNVVIYRSRAEGWGGIMNNLQGVVVTPPPPPPPPPPPSPPPPPPPPPPATACTHEPIICTMYDELFGRLPDDAGADYWLSVIQSNGWNTDTYGGQESLRTAMKNAAVGSDCTAIGGTYDPVTNSCNGWS